ncbi:predicted protein [Streptomyces viridochromogenes DSM 40736]|uniref:Predicted protein n=1 Tax=Streptomyces viridochromogenes (strain DSM 40736 / JCM 4977 / BCRC 1201 / Tue 494) TaxID=591159 RepID=D9X881_STRVT|nr:hypothetical protein [Streptomyces viridochromogenes]EFL34119.1 predicted protein [Streptomyces viridochromogenes DSM 40736]
MNKFNHMMGDSVAQELEFLGISDPAVERSTASRLAAEGSLTSQRTFRPNGGLQPMARVPAPHRIGQPELEIEASVGTFVDDVVADKLASFLEEAEPLVYSPGTVPDPFAESPDMRVRVGIMTDGEWVWHLAWSDYVHYHRVSPPDEFLAHAAAMNYTASEISVERAMEIVEAEGLPMPETCLLPRVRSVSSESSDRLGDST